MNPIEFRRDEYVIWRRSEGGQIVLRTVASLILVIAVALLIATDNAQRGDPADRDVDRAFCFPRIEVAVSQLGVGKKLAKLRTFGFHRYCAARRILAKQGSLWTTQHFDLRHVECVEQLGLDRRHYEVVDQHHHRRLEIDNDVVLADAAHGETCRVEAGDGFGREVRHIEREIADVIGASLLDQTLVDHRHRDWRSLQPGFAASRGDHDVADSFSRVGRRLRGSGRGLRIRRLRLLGQHLIHLRRTLLRIFGRRGLRKRRRRQSRQHRERGRGRK